MSVTRFCFVVAAILAASGVAEASVLVAGRESLDEAIRIFQRRDFAEAKPLFERLATNVSATAEAKLYLGRIALEEERFAESTNLLEEAVRLNPTNAFCVLWQARGYGLQARKAGFPAGMALALKSRASFEKAVSMDPSLIEAREDLIRFYREAPGIVGGSRRAAIAHANELKKRDPYMGAIVQGDLLLDEKKPSEAERAYRAASELRPQSSEAYYRLGALHLKRREFSRAVSEFEKILRVNTNETKAHYYIGEVGAMSGHRLTRAEQALKTYLNTKPWLHMPSWADAHCRLGEVYERQGKREAARTEFQAALKLDPDHRDAKAGLRKLR